MKKKNSILKMKFNQINMDLIVKWNLKINLELI
jgi:hypothetical protein